MVESEGIQEIVIQVAIQAMMAVMMVLGDADFEPWLAPPASLRGPQRQRYDRPTLEKPSFNWNAQDKYIELLNFEMEVMNILEIKAYELTDEEKVPVIKNWLGREGLHNS